jgi:post-segregation antitoxin (ccd killing protein)
MVQKKLVRLRIKVPANVTVMTELVPCATPLAISSSPAAASAPVMQMDLTSAKTAEWLRKKSVASADCTSSCCCVRG